MAGEPGGRKSLSVARLRALLAPLPDEARVVWEVGGYTPDLWVEGPSGPIGMIDVLTEAWEPWEA